MKKIVLFPGQVTSPFFENEIEYINSKFEIVAIFSYGEKREDAEIVLRKHGIPERCLNIVDELQLSKKSLICLMFSPNVWREIIRKCIGKKKAIKRIAYCFFYQTFAIKVDGKLYSILQENKDIIFYSFWMTRGAYAMEYIKQKHAMYQISSYARAHGYDLYLDRNETGFLPFRDNINTSITRISFISNDGMDYYNKLYPNFVRTDVQRLGTYNNEQLRKNIITKNRVCIASCSTINQIKRLDLMIEILSKVDIEVKWIHIGDGELNEKIVKLANEKLHDSNVEFKFWGKVENTQILNLYIKEDVDFFINTSDSEGIPVSMMEALSCGIPIIARKVGGIAEIVDGKTGLLVDDLNDSSQQYINNFLHMRINNQQEYSMMSRRCAIKWEKLYAADINYRYFFERIDNE